MRRRARGRGQDRQSRCWRVFYGTTELVGEGTVLDLHRQGCRIIGCMPVEIGSDVRLCIWLDQNAEEIAIVHGSVRWVNGLQFGVVFDTSTRAWDERLISNLTSTLGDTETLKLP